jgi:hypothetical protein
MKTQVEADAVAFHLRVQGVPLSQTRHGLPAHFAPGGVVHQRRDEGPNAADEEITVSSPRKPPTLAKEVPLEWRALTQLSDVELYAVYLFYETYNQAVEKLHGEQGSIMSEVLADELEKRVQRQKLKNWPYSILVEGDDRILVSPANAVSRLGLPASTSIWRSLAKHTEFAVTSSKRVYERNLIPRVHLRGEYVQHALRGEDHV